MSREHTAESIIGGQRYRARIEQYDQVAFVSVIGGGDIAWCKIESPDAYAVMLAHGSGRTDEAMRVGDASILRMAAGVFALTQDDDDDPLAS